jgi:sulfide:quinone oxidoreductase
VFTESGDAIGFDLLMLTPPFAGASAALHRGITNGAYVNVDSSMRVIGVERMYAVGDCVDFAGPKMGHMAVRQAEVAAANLKAELEGNKTVAHYNHETRLVVDEADGDSLYLHKDLWANDTGAVRQGRFWSWAKRVQEMYWETSTFGLKGF